MSESLCFLNGEYLPLAEARVPVLDRGFIFGDGVYEVVPVYERRLFRFEEHLARLNRSLAKLRLPEPCTREEWLARCRQLVEARPEADQVVYIQVTRGVAPRDHVMPAHPVPTVFQRRRYCPADGYRGSPSSMILQPFLPQFWRQRESSSIPFGRIAVPWTPPEITIRQRSGT